MADFSGTLGNIISGNQLVGTLATNNNTFVADNSPTAKSLASGIIPSGIGFTSSSQSSTVDKRLYTIVPRYGRADYLGQGKSKDFTDRGPIASIKLLVSGTSNLSAKNNIQGVDISKDLADLTSSGTKNFQRFFLTDVNVSYNEKVQINTTFGDGEVTYTFGRQPIILNIAGILFDSLSNDWFTKFVTLYSNVLRATQLAQAFQLVQITLPNMIVVGSFLSFSHSQNAQRDAEISFQCSFLTKQITPLPVSLTGGSLSNPLAQLGGQIVNWSVGKGGAGGPGYSLSTGTSGGGLLNNISAGVTNLTGALAGAANLASQAGTSLNTFRSSLFSPVYGIISSITKIVLTTTGSVSKLISSFTNPLNAVLTDIKNISTQAVAVANLVENSIHQIASIPSQIEKNVAQTLLTLKYSAGVISRVPQDFAQIIKQEFRQGAIHNGAAILFSGKAGASSKAAILNSGKPYSVQQAYYL